MSKTKSSIDRDHFNGSRSRIAIISDRSVK